MYYNDKYYIFENDEPLDNIKNETSNILKLDRGLNVIKRKIKSNKTGLIKNKKINIYTSNHVGSRIRDAESGFYYENKVGSKDEDFFFKVILATGECKSLNGSNTLFYLSPNHYSNHLHCEVPQNIINNWQQKYNERMREFKNNTSNKNNISIK